HLPGTSVRIERTDARAIAICMWDGGSAIRSRRRDPHVLHGPPFARAREEPLALGDLKCPLLGASARLHVPRTQQLRVDVLASRDLRATDSSTRVPARTHSMFRLRCPQTLL